MKFTIFFYLGASMFSLCEEESFIRAADGPSPDHLVPVSRISSKSLLKIDSVSGALNQSIIWGVVDRSFGSVSIISLRGDLPEFMKLPSLGKSENENGGGNFEIAVYHLDVNNLSEIGKIEPKITKSISKTVSIRLQNLWIEFIKGTKYPPNAYKGVDGATFIFGAWYHGYGDILGEIWSPEEGRNKIMTDLLLEIEKYVVDDNEDKSIDLDEYSKSVATKMQK